MNNLDSNFIDNPQNCDKIYFAVGGYWDKERNRNVSKPTYPHELSYNDETGQSTIVPVEKVTVLTDEEKLMNQKQIRDEITGAYI